VGAGEKWKRKKEVGSVSTPVEVPSNFSAVVVLMSGAFNQSSPFTLPEHNKYIYKLDNGRLPEKNNHHSWLPMIIEKNIH